MAAMSQDLLFRFMGIDNGAGAEFDRMASKSARTGAMASKALLGITVAAGAVAVTSVDMAAKFQSSMLRLHTQANVSNAAVAKFSAGVLDMAGSVATTPKVLADAAYHIASVGQGSLSTAQELRVLKIAAEGAKLGGADLTDVTNGLDAAIVSGIKGVQNYSQAMGALNATVGAGDMTMQDLSDALGTGVLAVLKQYGVTLNQVGGALAVFGDNNIRGALAGNQLRMAVQALTKPSASAADALHALGLSGKDAFGHFAVDLQKGGLTTALEDLRHRLTAAGFTGAKAGKELTDAFGRRAGVGLSVLVGQMTRYQSKLHEVSTGATGFGSSWSGYTKSFGFALDSARAAAESLMVSLGTKLLPTATSMMKWVAGTAIPDLSKFAHWLEENSRWTKPLAIGLGLVGAALMVAFGGPVAIIVGLTAITVGIIQLYKHSERFRSIVQTAGRIAVATWHGMRTAGLAVFHALSAVWDAFANGPLAYLQARFADFAAFWHSHSQEIHQVTRVVWHAISSLIRTDMRLILDVVRPALTIISAAFRVAWDLIAGIVKTAWHLIGGVVKTGMRTILDTIGIILDLITGHWSKAWTDAKQLVSDAIHGVNSILLSFGQDAASLLYNAGRDIVQGLINGVKSMFGSVTSVLHDITKLIPLHKGPPEKDRLLLFAAGQSIIQGLVNGMRSKTGDLRISLASISRLLFDGMSGGWTGYAGRLKNLLGTEVENAINALTSRLLSVLNRQMGILKAAQTKLRQDLASMRSDTASLAGSIAGPADLSGAFTTDANGNPVLGNVGQFASAQVAPLEQFAADLKWAAKHHLNPVDLAQIANLGAVQGDQILRQLMSGQSSIATLNSAQALTAKYSTAAASTVEGSIYARELAGDRRQVHEQTHLLRELRDEIRRLRREAARDVARNIHITVDAKGRMKLTDEDGREIVRELRKLATKGIKP